MNSAILLLVAIASVANATTPCSPQKTCPYNQYFDQDNGVCIAIPGGYCDGVACQCGPNSAPSSDICECNYPYIDDVSRGRCVSANGDNCGCDEDCLSGMICGSGACDCPPGTAPGTGNACHVPVGSHCNPAMEGNPENKFPCVSGAFCNPGTQRCEY